jgi:hypothetical protein
MIISFNFREEASANRGRAIESSNHSKNRVGLKSQMSRGRFLKFTVLAFVANVFNLRKMAAIAACFAITTMFSGCKKDDPVNNLSPVDKEGLTEDIRNAIPDEILNKAKDLGFKWNGGNTPPNIEGKYYATPVILVNSTNQNDNIGGKFHDGTFIFSEQNNLKLTVRTYVEEMDVGSDAGVGSFIVGKGDKFSVFVVLLNMYSQTSYFFISGKIEKGGIRDFHFLLLNEDFQGRLFKDGDGLAERIDVSVENGIHFLEIPMKYFLLCTEKNF